MSQPASARLSRAALAWGLVFVLLVGAILWVLMRTPKAATAPSRGLFGQPAVVRVVPVERGPLSVQVKAIGTVTPLNTVQVRSRVAGELVRLAFEEGAEVAAGDLLAEIDPRPYQVKLAQAEGQARQNQAQLQNAEQDLALYEELFKDDAIARQTLTEQRALVAQLRAAAQTNQAQIDDARLQLSWTRITAPVAGRVGLRALDPGNLVGANDSTALVTLTQTRPINVLFTVPETQLQALRDALGAQPLVVEAVARNDQTVLARGTLTTFDNQIDTATGTLKLKAEFSNDDDALFPNQFVNVRLFLRTLDDTLTIPSDAVQYGSRGTYVYVEHDGKVALRFIGLGPVDGERVAVLSGLEEGEQVVLEGIDRLRDGAPVVVTDGAPEAVNVDAVPTETSEDAPARSGRRARQ